MTDHFSKRDPYLVSNNPQAPLNLGKTHVSRGLHRGTIEDIRFFPKARYGPVSKWQLTVYPDTGEPVELVHWVNHPEYIKSNTTRDFFLSRTLRNLDLAIDTPPDLLEQLSGRAVWVWYDRCILDILPDTPSQPQPGVVGLYKATLKDIEYVKGRSPKLHKGKYRWDFVLHSFEDLYAKMFNKEFDSEIHASAYTPNHLNAKRGAKLIRFLFGMGCTNLHNVNVRKFRKTPVLVWYNGLVLSLFSASLNTEIVKPVAELDEARLIASCVPPS